MSKANQARLVPLSSSEVQPTKFQTEPAPPNICISRTRKTQPRFAQRKKNSEYHLRATHSVLAIKRAASTHSPVLCFRKKLWGKSTTMREEVISSGGTIDPTPAARYPIPPLLSSLSISLFTRIFGLRFPSISLADLIRVLHLLGVGSSCECSVPICVVSVRVLVISVVNWSIHASVWLL